MKKLLYKSHFSFEKGLSSIFPLSNSFFVPDAREKKDEGSDDNVDFATSGEFNYWKPKLRLHS